jgi:hypothetical protein
MSRRTAKLISKTLPGSYAIFTSWEADGGLNTGMGIQPVYTNSYQKHDVISHSVER